MSSRELVFVIAYCLLGALFQTVEKPISSDGEYLLILMDEHLSGSFSDHVTLVLQTLLEDAFNDVEVEI